MENLENMENMENQENQENQEKQPELPLVIIKTTFKITRTTSPVYRKTIFVNENNFQERYVLNRFCAATLNRGGPCGNLQMGNYGYCDRHIRYPRVPLPDIINLVDANKRIRGHPMYVNVDNPTDRYVVMTLCKADTTKGDMCNNFPNAMRGYCYTHWGMVQRGTLIEAASVEEINEAEEESESSSSD